MAPEPPRKATVAFALLLVALIAGGLVGAPAWVLWLGAGITLWPAIICERWRQDIEAFYRRRLP